MVKQPQMATFQTRQHLASFLSWVNTEIRDCKHKLLTEVSSCWVEPFWGFILQRKQQRDPWGAKVTLLFVISTNQNQNPIPDLEQASPVLSWAIFTKHCSSVALTTGLERGSTYTIVPWGGWLWQTFATRSFPPLKPSNEPGCKETLVSVLKTSLGSEASLCLKGFWIIKSVDRDREATWGWPNKACPGGLGLHLLL